MDEFAQHSDIKWNGDVGVVQYGPGDSKMIVMFYLKPVLNQGASQAENRPIYEDKTYVRIHPPGERLNIIDREATVQDKRRFPMQWHQFQQNAPQESTGTPIEMLYPAQPSVSAALRASGVHTIEQCAELSAHAIESIGMGAQQWVNEAARYIQVANKGVKHSEMKKALDDKDREINHLKHKLDLVMAEVANLRDRASHAITTDEAQQMFANGGQPGRRPVFAPGKQLNKNFDVQTAQIAATHATKDLAKPKKAAKELPSAKRQRSRIAN